MAKKDSFENSLKSLEKVVEKLEDGERPLEDALALFQEGRAHAKACETKLNQVERKIQILMEDEEGRTSVQPFDDGVPSKPIQDSKDDFPG